MKPFKTRRFALALFACAASPLLAQTATITGTWTTQTEVQGIAINETCELTQDASGALTGTCDTPGGQFKLTGKVTGTSVNFSHPAAYQQEEMTVSFFGKIDAPDSVTGSVDLQPINAGGAFAMKKIK